MRSHSPHLTANKLLDGSGKTLAGSRVKIIREILKS